MNIAMEQTEEYVDGQLKARYGDCFIRGNNGEPHIYLDMGMFEYRLQSCTSVHNDDDERRAQSGARLHIVSRHESPLLD
jgi:hypothetical protein